MKNKFKSLCADVIDEFPDTSQSLVFCLSLANNMQILAADEVEVTNEGLKIIYKQTPMRLRKETKLPVMRKF